MKMVVVVFIIKMQEVIGLKISFDERMESLKTLNH